MFKFTSDKTQKITEKAHHYNYIQTLMLPQLLGTSR